MTPRPSADRWLGAAVFLAGAGVVLALPHHLGDSDESLLLYETLRLLRGEVYFRDVFNNISPGAHAYFALLFALGGASIAVARGGIAAVQGAIALLVYAAARRLGVRPGLAAAAGLAHLAVALPAFPYASPHWLATLCTAAVLWLALGRRWARRAAGALPLGLALGALAAVHHHKAPVLAAGVGLLLVADRLLDRRYGVAAPIRLGACLAWVAAGAAAVALPFYVYFLARSGWAPFYAALIEFPLVHYRQSLSAGWGEVSLVAADLAAYTAPRLLALLPLALLPVALRLPLPLARRADEAGTRRRLALLVIGAGAVLSIRYYPDFIHLAFIAPPMLVALADDVEGLLAALVRGRRRPSGALGVGIPAALVAAIALQIGVALRGIHRDHAVAVETPFGRVALRTEAHAELVRTVQRLAAAGRDRQLFCYPAYPALYLMTGTDNPTPFQILLPGYNPDAAIAASLAMLEARRPPLVLVVEALVKPGDPIVAWVRAHYQPVGPPVAIPGAPVLYRLADGEARRCSRARRLRPAARASCPPAGDDWRWAGAGAAPTTRRPPGSTLGSTSRGADGVA